MILFDTRMVYGYPLQYYNPQSAKFSNSFPKYDYYSMTDISEELLMPNSPHSIHSDSDNSMSSTDVTSKPIMNTINKSPIKSNSVGEISDVKCGWRQCGSWFESLDQLANHVSKSHASSGPSGLFYCGWEGCTRNNKGFNARYKMLVHVRTHTNQKPHQCCQCDKSFSRAENLKIHSRSHSGEKPYVCPVPGCNKAYSNSSDRFKHTRTHQVEKPYSCKVPGCPKRYTDPSSLRKHVKTYKHFPYDQLKHKNAPVDNNCIKIVEKVNSQQQKLSNIENIAKTDSFYPSNDNILNSHECLCPNSCCLKTSLSKAAELLQLGALINFSGTKIENVSWNKLIDPLMQHSKQIYTNFKDEQMDIDAPLDLTVHRK